jgi:tRNA pseudouridine13 synthase
MNGLPDWPQLSGPGLAGRYRMTPEDFRVDEVPGWTADGSGEHLLVEVEKRGENTARVAEALARITGLDPATVGWCGAKDRHAVTRQWFSLRDPGGEARLEAGAGEAGWRVLDSVRHGRKLRRGDHAVNRFRLRLLLEQPVSADVLDRIRDRLAAGVANYFGPQRFGRDGGNLELARQWVRDGRLPRRGARRGWILSAARSLLFNEVLAARVAAGTATREIDGDRLDADGRPTGPLWGRGRSPATGAAAEREQTALAPWREWCERLEHAGLVQERRALVCVPAAPEVAPDGHELTLAFSLPPGVFATSVLAGLGAFRDASSDDCGASA